MTKARRTHSYMQETKKLRTELLRKELKARSPQMARVSRQSFLGTLVEENKAFEFFNVIFKGAVVFVSVIYVFEHFAGGM